MKIRIFILDLGLLMLILNYSCKKDSIIPNIVVSPEYTVAEDATGSEVNISITLSESSDKEVSVEYSTADSTAVGGTDYVSVSGAKLTFAPGSRSGSINISIIQNTSVKEDVYFIINFSNAVNCEIQRQSVRIKIINVDYATLVWSDEFESGPLNTSDWNYEYGAGGWGNNELETYTDETENVHIDSGYLHITALNPSTNYYTSGRITTQGKQEFTYGKFEIRAQLPEGQGIWPALWMLGSNFSTVGWASCGEIDMMEYLGHQPSVVYGTIHWDSDGYKHMGSSYSLSSGTFHSGFHVFTFIWTANNLRWLVDGHQYYSLGISSIGGFPINLPQFFISNVAVGGNWPGDPDETTTFPQHMIVDYIRVYQ